MTDETMKALSARVRAALPATNIREVRMFGSDCFMVDGVMAVAANKDGSLLVRVDREADATHLEKPHAGRAEMGENRSMGPGWIRVEPAGLARDPDVADWIATALHGTSAT